MSQNSDDIIYDVVIVGGGVGGAIVAKTLVQAGKSVLVIEAGDGVTPTDDVNVDLESGQIAYAANLDRYYNQAAKVPNAPYKNLDAAPSPDVLDIKSLADNQPQTNSGYFVQTGPKPFGSDYARTPGGTTMHWLGTCLRMLPNDFQMKTKYDVARDWPFSYDALRPYYEMAEYEIGVSADVAQLSYPNMGPHFFGSYQYPMSGLPQSYLDQSLTKSWLKKPPQIQVDDGQGGKVDVKIEVTPTPQGRNSHRNPNYPRQTLVWDSRQQRLVWTEAQRPYVPVGATWDDDTGQRCEGNASCVPICPVQAKYNALKTLRKAARDEQGKRNPLFHISYRSVVSEVLVEPGSQTTDGDRLVTGIRYQTYEMIDGKCVSIGERIARGKRYVLAAHAIENAKILLASGLANSSGQVGRNLMDHVVLLAWGLRKPNRPVYPFRGPGSTSNIPNFRDGDFRKVHSAFILPLDNWGWSWPVFSPGTEVDDALDQGKFGTALRNQVEEILTCQVLFHPECEQLPEENNQVMIDRRYKDKFGNVRPVIRYEVSDYLKKAFVKAKQICDELFDCADITDHSKYPASDPCYFEYTTEVAASDKEKRKGIETVKKREGFFFRGAGHLVGTHRMGSDRSDSVVNPAQQTWDHSNLYLVGCGNMVTLGTSNPTLTMAALAFWAAENILKDLNGAN